MDKWIIVYVEQKLFLLFYVVDIGSNFQFDGGLLGLNVDLKFV